MNKVDPEKCRTCGKPYVKPSKSVPNYCSNGFHGCRDCVWKDGVKICRCKECRDDTVDRRTFRLH